MHDNWLANRKLEVNAREKALVGRPLSSAQHVHHEVWHGVGEIPVLLVSQVVLAAEVEPLCRREYIRASRLVQPQRLRVRLGLRLGAVKHQDGLERMLYDGANELVEVRAKGERRALIAAVVPRRTADPRLHQDVPHVDRDVEWQILSLPAAELEPDCLDDGVEHGLVDTDDPTLRSYSARERAGGLLVPVRALRATRPQRTFR
ncbi:hypothetical protein T492DRAFT_970384, partial [Pavlovales sp. CCMP2436]